MQANMEALPIDMSNPEVRNYLSLIRLQVLTPLSLLINIATVLICSSLVHPSITEIMKRYPSSISPKPAVIAPYVVLIFLGQLGFCVLLVIARKPETKQMLVKGVGLSLVISNWVMAGWAVTWVLRWFLPSTILQGILLLLLLYSNMNLLVYHAPMSSRPLDMALVHAPLRFFLILPLSLLFPYSLFIKLGFTYAPTGPNAPIDYEAYSWSGFGVVFGTNILGLIIILLRRDIVWCVAATWICASIWSERLKPASVYITVIIFTVIHPLALVAAFVHHRFFRRKPIILRGEDEFLHHGNRQGEEETERDAQEIDSESLRR